MAKIDRRKIKKECKAKNWNNIAEFVRSDFKILNVVIDKRKGRHIVHILSYNLALNALSLVLNYEFNYLIQDKKCNTGLHLALKACMKRNLFNDVVKYWDLFVEKNIDIKTVKNKRGESPFDLLKLISEKLSRLTFDRQTVNENEWIEELAEDAYSDYMNEWGKYEQDYYDTETKYETHDQWADRIGNEYREQTSYAKPKPSSSTKSEQRSYLSDEDDRKFRNKHAKAIAEYTNHSKYEQFKIKWLAFESRIRILQQQDRIYEHDIPWFPESEDIIKMISDWLGVSDSVRKELKMLQVAWHPDRFMNRCGQFIDEIDKSKIIEKVVKISQKINNALCAHNK